MKKYNKIIVHENLKGKFKVGDILNTEQVLDIFGTDKNKLEYEKYNGLRSSKVAIFNRFKSHCVFEELEKNKYKIKKIRKVPVDDKILKILDAKNENQVLYYLTVLLANHLKELVDNGERTLNVMILDLAFVSTLINDNYKTIKFNQNKVAEYYNTKEEYVSQFVESSNNIIKYYLETAIGLLEDYDIITRNQNRKIVKNYKKFIDKTTVQEYESISWATKEENELINIVIESIFKDYKKIYRDERLNDFTFKDFYFGKYSKEINARLHDELIQYDIIRFYNGYELSILLEDNIDSLLDEIPNSNKSINVLTKKMNNLIIEKVCKNVALKNMDKILLENDSLAHIYTGLTSIDTAEKLGKVSLNYNSQYKLADKMNLSYEKKKATKVKTIENVKVINKTNKQTKKTKRKSK